MPKHILIVDDEPQFRFAAAVSLRRAGYEVSEADDGYEALLLITNGNSGGGPLREGGNSLTFDLLVVDVQMPKMSGIELICELRRQGIDIPTLVVSGFGDRALLRGLAESGCEHFLGKPFMPQEMVARIDDMLKG